MLKKGRRLTRAAAKRFGVKRWITLRTIQVYSDLVRPNSFAKKKDIFFA